MIYPNLAKAMSERRVSFGGLSKGTGIPRTTLYEKLNGKTRFYIQEAIAIKSFLKVKASLETLFAEEE